MEAALLAGAFARLMEQKWPAGAWRHRRGDRSFQQLANLRGMNPIAGCPGEPPHAFEQGYLQKFPVHLNMALTNRGSVLGGLPGPSDHLGAPGEGGES